MADIRKKDDEVTEEWKRFLESDEFLHNPECGSLLVARHFAEWQRERMMREAVEGEIGYWNLRGLSVNVKLPKSVSEGDKVLIIIKHD